MHSYSVAISLPKAHLKRRFATGRVTFEEEVWNRERHRKRRFGRGIVTL